MRSVSATLRMALAIIVLTIAFLVILLVSVIPIRVRRATLAGWVATWLARSLLRIFALKVVWTNKAVFARHEGFIFPNHISYTDILIMAAFAPVRFLAKAEVAAWPMIGYIGKSIGSVFVKRENKESRTAAREALRHLEPFPPIILFPEGGTGPPGELRPFRYGAFEIVISSGVPFLPCIIDYGDNADAVYWGDENLFQSIYKLLTRSHGQVTATVVPLRPVEPLPDDDPKLLAIAIHGAMEALRQSRTDEAKLIEPGI